MTKLVEIKVQAMFDDANELTYFVIENVAVSISRIKAIKALPGSLTADEFNLKSKAIQTVLEGTEVGGKLFGVKGKRFRIQA
jgi:hypothetical protein